MNIMSEKIAQIKNILVQLDIESWLVFVRETSMQSDPVANLVIGHDVVWPSFFIYTRTGEAIALVGNFDQENFVRSGCFTDVQTYTEGAGKSILDILTGLNPKSIGLNYSLDNPAADGLTHGMFLLLNDYLKGTPFTDRFVSAEEISSRLRSRKILAEIGLLSKAAEMADRAWQNAIDKIKEGLTEHEIGAIIDSEIANLGGINSFPTIVNAGNKTKPGHSLPTDAKLEPGDLLHVDFGVRWQDYCSDIQRLLYIKHYDETKPPDKLLQAFDLIKQIITDSAARTVVGATGCEIDTLARKALRDHGHPEYHHALGH
ncbi:MAG: aminopeptidase P family protein, partial [FCB group bacterium]|nr:aminopeptidase P family protein [FCB group bacterium]